jgi:hypothetical protein
MAFHLAKPLLLNGNLSTPSRRSDDLLYLPPFRGDLSRRKGSTVITFDHAPTNLPAA